MKHYIHLLVVCALSLGLQSLAWADSHEKSLDAIIKGFAVQDAAEQYEARRELATYVAKATAPDQENGADKVTKELLGYLNNGRVDPEAKKYIIRDLARVGSESAVAPLSKILLGRDALLAEAARQALEQIPGKQASDALEDAIDQVSSNAKRQSLLRTLANRNDPDRFRYFSKGLSSGDSILALESIYALTRLGNDRAADVLEEAYLGKPAPELKLELERSLVALEGTSGDALLEIHKNGLSAPNRQAALARLVKDGYPESTDLLKAALLSADSDVRSSAIDTAMSYGKESLVRNRVGHLPDEDRLIVLGKLDAFDGKGGEGLALKAAEEGSGQVQIQAVYALSNYGGNKTVNTVLWHFSGDDKELKQAATYALARMPGNAMNNRLNKMLNSEEEEAVLLAIEALAHREIPNSKNRLFRQVNSENPRIAREALRTFSVIADEEDLYKLLFLSRRADQNLSTLIVGMLKKVTPEIGSLELQAKVKAL